MYPKLHPCLFRPEAIARDEIGNASLGNWAPCHEDVWGIAVWLHILLTSVLHGREWSPRPSYPQRNSSECICSKISPSFVTHYKYKRGLASQSRYGFAEEDRETIAHTERVQSFLVLPLCSLHPYLPFSSFCDVAQARRYFASSV
jgi:hypothetical protein